MIQESNKNDPGTAMVNICPGNTIRGTFICSDPQKAQIKRIIICSNCKNPVDKCGICGRQFKSRDPVYCSLLDVHYCKRCVNRIRKDQERYRSRKRGSINNV